MEFLPPQGFGPEAKTRGGIIVVRAYIEYIYIVYTRQNFDLAKVGPQVVSVGVIKCPQVVSVGVINFLYGDWSMMTQDKR